MLEKTQPNSYSAGYSLKSKFVTTYQESKMDILFQPTIRWLGFWIYKRRINIVTTLNLPICKHVYMNLGYISVFISSMFSSQTYRYLEATSAFLACIFY